MPGYAEYFASHRPKPLWLIGDRVFGRWNKIPFVGTVANDNMVSELEGSKVSVFLDLPIIHQKSVVEIVSVKQNQLKKLVKFD